MHFTIITIIMFYCSFRISILPLLLTLRYTATSLDFDMNSRLDVSVPE